MVRSVCASRSAVVCVVVTSLASAAAGCTSSRVLASPDDARLRTGDHRDGFVVATTTPWHERVDPLTLLRFERADGGWSAPVSALRLRVDDEGVWTNTGMPGALAAHSGWRWSDIAHVQVENVSGGKTLGAIIGYAALTIALLPLALVMRGGSIGSFTGAPHASGGGGGGGIPPIGGGGGVAAAPADAWPAESFAGRAVHARPMFTRGSRFRAIAAPLLSLDAAVGIRGDLISTGVLGRVRFGEIFEIGGGVRSLETRGSQSTAGVFQAGFHLPLDAGMRLAIPLGFEIGAGGAVDVDLRIPWGLRYTSRSGRWFATASPATPSYLHVAREPRRWSLVAGSEIGVRF